MNCRRWYFCIFFTKALERLVIGWTKFGKFFSLASLTRWKSVLVNSYCNRYSINSLRLRKKSLSKNFTRLFISEWKNSLNLVIRLKGTVFSIEWRFKKKRVHYTRGLFNLNYSNKCDSKNIFYPTHASYRFVIHEHQTR